MPWFSFHFNDFAVSFLSILFEGIPFLLLGSLLWPVGSTGAKDAYRLAPIRAFGDKRA